MPFENKYLSVSNLYKNSNFGLILGVVFIILIIVVAVVPTGYVTSSKTGTSPQKGAFGSFLNKIASKIQPPPVTASGAFISMTVSPTSLEKGKSFTISVSGNTCEPNSASVRELNVKKPDIVSGQTVPFSAAWTTASVGTHKLEALCESKSLRCYFDYITKINVCTPYIRTLSDIKTVTVTEACVIKQDGMCDARCETAQNNPTDCDTNPPTVALSWNPKEPLVNQPVAFSTSATDDVGVKSVKLFVDKVEITPACTFGTTSTCSYQTSFSTAGDHSVTATAQDSTHATSRTATIRVFVSGGGGGGGGGGCIVGKDCPVTQ